MTTGRKPSRRRSGPPTQTPATWISARARNALRRPFFIAVVSSLTFIAALLALALVPRQARKAADALRPAAALRPDTEPTVSALREANRQVAAANANLASVRAQLNQLVAATAAAATRDTAANGLLISPALRGQRDSLKSNVEQLEKLLARAENAPLLGSYRALAQAAPMQGDVRVKALLDSLVDIEKERDSYSAVGGVDPVFVALTARANELGHNIVALADARKAALSRELVAIAPAAPVISAAVAALPFPDTIAAAQAVVSARDAEANVNLRLTRERDELQKLDIREEKANELLGISASPSAILAAALIFGCMLGFGVTLFEEVRRPRVADAFEAERTTGVKVLGIVRPLPAVAERRRRASDHTGPPYMDSGGDGHQLIYLSIAAAGANTVMLTVTGDSPAVAAVIATNFAAIAADEARATLLIDTDADASPITKLLRIRSSAGVAGLAKRTAEWPDVTRAARVGRDRSIDVVPDGGSGATIDDVKGVLERNGVRLSRRYDAIVMVSSEAQARQGISSSLPIADVIYCARAGLTPLSELKASIDAIVAAGASVRGIVLWNAPDPQLDKKRPQQEVVEGEEEYRPRTEAATTRA